MAELHAPAGYAAFGTLLGRLEPEELRQMGDDVESLIATPGWAAVCRVLKASEDGLVGRMINPEGAFDESVREMVRTAGQIAGLRMVPSVAASIRYAAARSREQAETGEPGVPGEGGTEQ